MYGIRFHMASDREGTKINLAVSHMGVLVFQVSGRTGRGRAGLSPPARGLLLCICWWIFVVMNECYVWKRNLAYHLTLPASLANIIASYNEEAAFLSFSHIKPCSLPWNSPSPLPPGLTTAQNICSVIHSDVEPE